MKPWIVLITCRSSRSDKRVCSIPNGQKHNFSSLSYAWKGNVSV